VTGQGFCRKLRLLTASDYKQVFEQSQFKVSSAQILVLARENGRDEARLGLVIAKKHIRLAVQRNRIKRLVRESFRQHQSLLSGLDIVILARSGLDKLDNTSATSTVNKLWLDLNRKRNRQDSK
jgi:ribonuclease P protein component